MVSNSNNWQTEAELRNKRKAKADSMSALLDHVEWNPETLEISLSGITLNWGDIEGAEDVVKKDADGIAYMTRITENTIETGYITANHLTLAGGSVNIKTSSETEDRIELTYTDTYGTRKSSLNPRGITFENTRINTSVTVNSLQSKWESTAGGSWLNIDNGGISMGASTGSGDKVSIGASNGLIVASSISASTGSFSGNVTCNDLKVSGIQSGTTSSYNIVVCGSSGILYRSNYTVKDMGDWSK